MMGSSSISSRGSRRRRRCSASSLSTIPPNCTGIGSEETARMALERPYDNIPGATVFDAKQARKGYHLNMFCMSLMKAPNRERFRANERAYLDEWAMSEEQRQAVLARDYNRMIELGGNIYFLAKIFSTDGK